LDRVSYALTERLRTLAERYVTPIPLLAESVEVLSGRVAGHLKAMGFQ
jgi:type I restriction enzyme M protein